MTRTPAVTAVGRHEAIGPDRLNLNAPQAPSRRLKSQPRTLRTTIVEDVKNYFRAIERPLEIDQFEPQVPLLDAGLPPRELVLALGLELLPRAAIVVGHCAKNLSPIFNQFRVVALRSVVLGRGVFQEEPALQAAMTFDDHLGAAGERSPAGIGEARDLGDRAISNEHRLSHSFFSEVCST